MEVSESLEKQLFEMQIRGEKGGRGSHHDFYAGDAIVSRRYGKQKLLGVRTQPSNFPMVQTVILVEAKSISPGFKAVQLRTYAAVMPSFTT